MTIRENLRRAIHDFVSGRSSLSDLRDWRRRHIREIVSSRVRGVRPLYGGLAAVLAEYDIGHRDETSVREALARELAASLRAPSLFVGAAGRAMATTRAPEGWVAVTKRSVISAAVASGSTTVRAQEVHTGWTSNPVHPVNEYGISWGGETAYQHHEGVVGGTSSTAPSRPLVGAAA